MIFLLCLIAQLGLPITNPDNIYSHKNYGYFWVVEDTVFHQKFGDFIKKEGEQISGYEITEDTIIVPKLIFIYRDKKYIIPLYEVSHD